MEREQLVGRYLRLKQELATAYRTQPWHSGRINRLADDIANAERELVQQQSAGMALPKAMQQAA